MSLLKDMANFHNSTPTGIAIAWLLSHPSNIMPIIGTNSLSRIKYLAEACNVNLDRQSWFEIYETANGHEVP